MKRYIKRTDTGLYWNGGGEWTPLARAYNYRPSMFARHSVHNAAKTLGHQDRARVVVVTRRRRKPKVSDGERAFNAFQGVGGKDWFRPWIELSEPVKLRFEAAAKAARSRK